MDLTALHTLRVQAGQPARLSIWDFIITLQSVWHDAIISIIINEDLSLKTSQELVFKEWPHAAENCWGPDGNNSPF